MRLLRQQVFAFLFCVGVCVKIYFGFDLQWEMVFITVGDTYKCWISPAPPPLAESLLLILIGIWWVTGWLQGYPVATAGSASLSWPTRWWFRGWARNRRKRNDRLHWTTRWKPTVFVCPVDLTTNLSGSPASPTSNLSSSDILFICGKTKRKRNCTQ